MPPPLVEPQLTAETRTHVEEGDIGLRIDTYLEGILDHGLFDVENGEMLEPPCPVPGLNAPYPDSRGAAA